jgi:VanZ family protein
MTRRSLVTLETRSSRSVGSAKPVENATLLSASDSFGKLANPEVDTFRMTSRFTYWIPAICVAIVISLFSTHFFSAEQTGRVLLPVLRWLFPSANNHALRLMHFGIRKAAHVTEFAIFSIAVFRGVRAERHGWRLDWAIWTLLIAVGYAGLDEWHQSFVPFREARFRDVLIDASGAALAQIIVWVYAMLHRGSPDWPGQRDGAIEAK